MKSLVFITFLYLLSNIIYAAPTKVTIYTDDAYKPYSYEENGKAKGIYVNIIRAVFDKMPEYDVIITPVPWQRGKKIMESGKGFGLSTAYFHGHDWPYLYPYSLPYANEVLNVYCLKKVLKTARPNWPDDYKGLKIGRPSGFDGFGGSEFNKMVKNKEIILDESKGIVTQIKKIGAKRLDCIIMEETAFNHELKKSQNNRSFDPSWEVPTLSAEISKNNVYIGYSKKALQQGKYPFHMDFRQKFDALLFQMIRSGEINRIANKI